MDRTAVLEGSGRATERGRAGVWLTYTAWGTRTGTREQQGGGANDNCTVLGQASAPDVIVVEIGANTVRDCCK